MIERDIIAVVGLGYVGLPLALAFGKHFVTIGFDEDVTRLHTLRRSFDRNNEVDTDEFLQSRHLRFASDKSDLKQCNIFIVAVPTPVFENGSPNLAKLFQATETVARFMNYGAVVIYESTVTPGTTRNECIPLIEKISGLKLNRDFFVGYSPERINPGDENHTLSNTKKLVSASEPGAKLLIASLYRKIVQADVIEVDCIETAEAAKLLENVQRDVNIALINEFSLIYSDLGIDTSKVIEAAASKWNFAPYYPGMVGGHCIGVDSYYMLHCEKRSNRRLSLTRMARMINESISPEIASRLFEKMLSLGIEPEGSRILIMGITFKENCSDIRNSKSLELAKSLQGMRAIVDVLDPWVDPKQIESMPTINLVNSNASRKYDAVVIAVAHAEFAGMKSEIKHMTRERHVIFDVKSIFSKDFSDLRL